MLNRLWQKILHFQLRFWKRWRAEGEKENVLLYFPKYNSNSEFESRVVEELKNIDLVKYTVTIEARV